MSDRQENRDKEIIVNSSKALNDKKVLLMRESFGVALYPYMNVTFSTIKQQHYQDVLNKPEYFRELIRDFKPDLVIVTTIERNSVSGYFGIFPN